MATATINWTPPGGAYSQNQDVSYKTMQTSTWNLHSVVSAATNSAVITDLLDNVIYHFRITNNCAFGTNATSTIYETMYMTCPAVSLDPTADTVDFTFSHLGGDISHYTVELLNTVDTVIAGIDFLSPGATISGTFGGLYPENDYKVRVTVFAAGVYTLSFSRVCTPVSFTTEAVVCNTPSNLLVGMSAGT